MQVEKAIEKFLEGESIIVAGKTFDTDTVEEIRLETGDKIYWVRDGGDLWLSVDPESEEIILFHTVEEEIDSSGDTVYFKGEDYEFEFEGIGRILDDGEETDEIIFRDFSGPDGEVLRAAENTVSNEIETSIGTKITDEDLQEA
ncbi:MAG: hypothetical protein ABH826_02645 [Patescibacteria group bacterium]|nr:hypothetical protein [Patescibacteria group bacterium]